MYDIITLGGADVDLYVKTLAKPEIISHLGHKDIAYHLGDKVLIDDLLITTGGGGTNTAVAFSRLGLKTGFIGLVGDDVNGRHILNELKKEKVDFLGSEMKGAVTGISLILPTRKDRTILTYKGINDYLTINDIKLSKAKSKWLYVSSMLGQGLETAEKIVHLAKKKGTKIAMNFSLYLAAKGLDYLSPLLQSADILVLNREEAHILTGKKDIVDIFDSIYVHTSAIIVITDGSGDIHASDSLRIYIKNVHPVNSVDKTGAGDAFAAGFTYAIMKGKTIDTAMDYGHKEALSVLGHIGAKNNLLRKL